MISLLIASSIKKKTDPLKKKCSPSLLKRLLPYFFGKFIFFKFRLCLKSPQRFCSSCTMTWGLKNIYQLVSGVILTLGVIKTDNYTSIFFSASNLNLVYFFFFIFYNIELRKIKMIIPFITPFPIKKKTRKKILAKIILKYYLVCSAILFLFLPGIPMLFRVWWKVFLIKLNKDLGSKSCFLGSLIMWWTLGLTSRVNYMLISFLYIHQLLILDAIFF